MRTMIFRAGVLVLAMVAASAMAAEELPAADPDHPDVEAAIPESIRALGVPSFTSFEGGLRMAVSTHSELAQNHVNQGLNHLHGGWEFEAARHFAAAMREDPECLLAHWGMVMSLLTPSPETGPARNAATDRLLTLIENGHGSALERGYVFALVQYIEEGPLGAAAAFGRVGRQFPNDVQSVMLEALFSRGGFDAQGNPTPDQLRAEKSLLELVKRFPENPMPLNALLTIRAEGADLAGSLELARHLCAIVTDYPPFFHLLGHYEWRCGEHARAVPAFSRATELYDQWMKENGVGVADCQDWVRSESYRITSLATLGEFDLALAAATTLAAMPLPDGRPQSPGARALWWEARTLPARLMMRRGAPGDAAEAMKSLPSADACRDARDFTLAVWWVNGLRLALEARRLLDAGEIAGARDVSEAISHYGESMVSSQVAASGGGERSAWNRAFHGFEVLASETRGLLAMRGPEATRGTAFNWFRAAVDRQRLATTMHPPAVLTPMAVRLGEFFMSENRHADAVEAYGEALAAFPNDHAALTGLMAAATAAGDAEKAAAAEAALTRLRAN